MRNEKQSEQVLVEKTVKITIQIFHDKELFDIYDNADEVSKEYLD